MTEEDIPEPGTVITTFRLRREQHDRLREIAVREDRSMGSVVRLLIDERIASEDRQPQS